MPQSSEYLASIPLLVPTAFPPPPSLPTHPCICVVTMGKRRSSSIASPKRKTAKHTHPPQAQGSASKNPVDNSNMGSASEDSDADEQHESTAASTAEDELGEQYGCERER